MMFIFNSFPVIMNSIIIDNGTIFTSINGLPTVTYSCITGGYEGIGNIYTDPMFVNPSAGDGVDYDGFSALWYLSENSPCIDAGNSSSDYNDIEDPDNPGFALWPALGTVTNDMGAYGGEGFTEFVGTENHNLTPEYNISLTNYPNPFNPNTTISFSLTAKDAKNAKVMIYNIKGQKVRTFSNLQINKSPNQQIVWNGTDDCGRPVSSGIYLCKLKKGRYSTTRKMILIK